MFRTFFIAASLLLCSNPSAGLSYPWKFPKIRTDKALNCFGFHVEGFANVVENWFTDAKADHVKFYLFSRESSANATVRACDDFSVTDLPYKHNRKTVIITHGFMSSGTVDWMEEMREAYLKLADVNVIAVDWQEGSNTWNYVTASISTKIVGAEIAKFLSLVKAKTLAESPEIREFGSLHLIGHSLGAHISARASNVLKELDANASVKFRIERLTGLDPAQPCFKSAGNSLRLEKTDAEFVDVIHTNAQSILLAGLGLPDRLGHADYYPNGGRIQIGCEKIDVKFWDFLMLPVGVIKTAICSHGRSHQLFIDSIRTSISNECKYEGHAWDRQYENIKELLQPGCQSDVCPEMGINAAKYHPNEDGVYFVPTGAKSHYCDVSNFERRNIMKLLGKAVEL